MDKMKGSGRTAIWYLLLVLFILALLFLTFAQACAYSLLSSIGEGYPFSAINSGRLLPCYEFGWASFLFLAAVPFTLRSLTARKPRNWIPAALLLAEFVISLALFPRVFPYQRDVWRSSQLLLAGPRFITYNALLGKGAGNIRVVPESLTEYVNSLSGEDGKQFLDPKSGQVYEYRKLGDTSFEICAAFETDGRRLYPKPVRKCVRGDTDSDPASKDREALQSY